MSEQLLDATMELRKRYRGYRPWALAQVSGHVTGHEPDDAKLWEFTSWPWIEREKVFIMARPVNDSTAVRIFEARKQIHPVRWSSHREKAYRRGFEDGVKYAVQEARKYREARGAK